jgi:hypothetical protein
VTTLKKPKEKKVENAKKMKMYMSNLKEAWRGKNEEKDIKKWKMKEEVER